LPVRITLLLKILADTFTASDATASSLTAELNTASEATASLPTAVSDTETFKISPKSELNGVDDMGARPNIYLRSRGFSRRDLPFGLRLDFHKKRVRTRGGGQLPKDLQDGVDFFDRQLKCNFHNSPFVRGISPLLIKLR